MNIETLIAKIQEIQTQPTFDDWSRGFCESIMDQMNRGRKLSEKQMQVLSGIFSQNTPEEVEKFVQWQDTYKQKWTEKAKVLCDYYDTQGPYFSNARNDIRAGRVPARRSFMKMANNKFAAKVLIEWEKEPRYPRGTPVMVRETISRTHGRFRLLLQKGGVVISTSEPIVTSATGCKRYKVLPYGSAETVLIEERYIKLYRKPREKTA